MGCYTRETRAQERELQVLLRVARDSSWNQVPADVPGLREVAGEADFDATVTALLSAGLVQEETGAGSGYQLTSSGRAVVEGMRRRREDEAFRRRACAAQMLDWLDVSRAEQNRLAFRGSKDLVPFTDEESASAARHLHENGLVDELPVQGEEYLYIWLTSRGQECADSDLTITEYLARTPGGSTSDPPTGRGPDVARALLAGSSSTPREDDTLDLELVRTFVAASLQAAPVLGVSDYVESLLAEVGESEDPTHVERVVRDVAAALEEASSGPLGTLLGAGLLALVDRD